jgi:putative cardiolipin synthase
VSGRESSIGRFFAFANDFHRLNHRMHNKLFIADGCMAVVGGRNLADEYFFRSKDANFLDMDVLIAGAVVPPLSELFDRYWNSEQVFPVQDIAASGLKAPALQEDFEDRTSAPTDPATLPPDQPDVYGEPPFSTELAHHRFHFIEAEAWATADLPSKASGNEALRFDATVTYRFLETLRKAHKEVLLFSPYFIPGDKGLARLKEARDHGIEVRIVTNALGTSDEPLVNLSYQRYREKMLTMGVQLYELSASRLTHDSDLKRALGSSRGRLHAKMAFVDRTLVLMGSMNMDPRSAYTNTEIGILVKSPELAQRILAAYKADNFSGIYQVRLKDDSTGIEWVGRDEKGEEVLHDEPDVSPWQRFKLWVLHLFVPEDLL